MTGFPRLPRLSRRTWLNLGALSILGGVLWLGSGDGPLGLAHHAGYALCHQITVRSYVFGDLQMPLCARCSGQYLGLLVAFTLAWRWGRLRAAELPPRWLLAALVAFLAVWAVDGFNSYMYLLLGRTFIYTPHNLLRVSTGMMQGLAVGFVFLPFFNQMFWAQPRRAPVLANGWQLVQALAAGGLVVLAVHSRWLPLFYVLALLSIFGILLLMSLVGALLAQGLLQREVAAHTARDLMALMLPGSAFAVLLLLGAYLLRALTEAHLHFTPPAG